MNEPFVLEVKYNKESLEYPAAFQRYGYTYRIVVSIQEHIYVFEPDEEGAYRILGTPAGVKPDIGLLQVIADKLSKF